jgi:hypothetical protein
MEWKNKKNGIQDISIYISGTFNGLQTQEYIQDRNGSEE